MDIQVYTSNNEILSEILGLCSLREKLSVGFVRERVRGSIHFALPENAMENLTEFTLYELDICSFLRANIDFKLFTKSKLEKITLEFSKIKNSATGVEISNSNWNLRELNVKDCVMENFHSFVKLLKLQKNLRCVHFQLSYYENEACNSEYEDLVNFLLNLTSLKILKLTLPQNGQKLFRSDFTNKSIEFLEIKSNPLSGEEKSKIDKCFSNLRKPITYFFLPRIRRTEYF